MQQFPKEWESWIRQNVALYGRLDEAEQERLRRDAGVLVESKPWSTRLAAPD